MPRVSKRSGPPAIVLGLNPTGLGIVKSLVSAGVSVVAVDRAPASPAHTHTWMSSRTQLCRKVLLSREGGGGAMTGALLDLAREYGSGLPVLPSGDSYVYYLSRNRETLEPHLRFFIPSEDQLDLIMQKGRFHRFCCEHGIATPRTEVGVTGENVRDVIAALRFPVLIKPEFRDERWDRMYAPTKALEARDAAEAEVQVIEAARTGASLMIQEIVPGPDSALYFSHAYLDADSRPVALWTGRKLRQYPPRFGTSTLTETRWVDEVAETTRRVGAALGLRGYLSIEFKRDADDGGLKLIEATPSRTWYPHLLGASAGVNLPLIWYQDLAGIQRSEVPLGPPADGVAWVDEYRDFYAAFESWRRGEVTLAAWLGGYSSVRSFALFSLRDPLPGLFVVLRLAMSALGKLGFRRIRTWVSKD